MALRTLHTNNKIFFTARHVINIMGLGVIEALFGQKLALAHCVRDNRFTCIMQRPGTILQPLKGGWLIGNVQKGWMDERQNGQF